MSPLEAALTRLEAANEAWRTWEQEMPRGEWAEACVADNGNDLLAEAENASAAFMEALDDATGGMAARVLSAGV